MSQGGVLGTPEAFLSLPSQGKMLTPPSSYPTSPPLQQGLVVITRPHVQIRGLSKEV